MKYLKARPDIITFVRHHDPFVRHHDRRSRQNRHKEGGMLLNMLFDAGKELAERCVDCKRNGELAGEAAHERERRPKGING